MGLWGFSNPVPRIRTFESPDVELITSVDAKTIMSKLEERYSRRNFALGTIHLAFGLDDAKKTGVASPLEQCLRYFKHNANTDACFGDIQSSVTLLSPEDQERFLQEIKAFAHGDKVLESHLSLD